ncbi:hypothetical protein CDL12_07063 [Handroanthus impetiginosus]|uniref:Uncharacterized protein n=1 Tax=Handroanthus impetiginosus TaxID=429701 RepID=A0A2G9HRV9_9LAMI|nr:hypothetical protein CDL12_07063 [Handroanthus impetiginosus]
MMALATNQFQGSRCISPSVSSSWSSGSKVQHFLPTFRPVGRKDGLISLKCRSFSSVGTSLLLGHKFKVFKISAFKGSSQHDDASGRANGSKSLKSHVKVSYLQHEGEGSSVESSELQNVVHAPYSAEDETTSRSLAIQNLFKNWLLLLRTPSQTQPVEEAPEKPSFIETSENTLQNEERGEFLKAVWCYFLDLDATIKIPLVLFAPLYLAVQLVCGSEVAKELTPFWILGPLTTALYFKVFRVVCSYYTFTFKQTVKVIEYIFRGKLKEDIQTHIWQPLADIKNANPKEVTRRKLKDLQGWWVEKYLDFLEFIWPWYCRTIRSLKGANLI